MKKSFFYQRSMLVVVMVVLACFAALPVFAAGMANTIALSPPAAVGKVAMSSSVYVQMQNMFVLPGSDGNTVTYQLSVHNGGKTDLNLSDYYLIVKTKSGIDLTATLFPEEKNQTVIPAGSVRDFHYYTVTDSQTKLSDLVFTWIEWDFNADDFERVLGKITVPSDYSSAVPSDRKQVLTINGVELQAFVQAAEVSKSDLYDSLTLTYKIANLGSKNAVLPNLTFALKNAEGAVYPLDGSGFPQGKTIRPSSSAIGILKGSIPSSADTSLQLLVSENAASDSGAQGSSAALELPLAAYAVNPVSPAANNGDVQSSYSISTDQGTYTLSFESLQLWPWSDKNILNAAFTLRNDTKQTLPIPQFTGYFVLDHAVTVSAGAIQTDQISSLQPGQQVQFQLQGQLAFSDSFKTAELLLQTQSGTDASAVLSDVLHLTLTQIADMTALKSGEAYTLDDSGASWTYTVRSVNTYAAVSDQVIAAQVDMTNMEKRFIPVTQLAAQFIAADGTIFPATVVSTDQKIMPQGEAELTVWSTFPKDVAASGLKLMLGEAVTGGKLSAAGETPDSFVKAVESDLPDEQTQVLADAGDLTINPYTLTLTDVHTPYWNYASSSFNFFDQFDYTLDKNLRLIKDMTDHHLVVKLLDRNGKELVSQELDLETATGTNQALELGSHEITVQGSAKSASFDSSKMTLQIYDEFQTNHLKLLFSKTFDLFQ